MLETIVGFSVVCSCAALPPGAEPLLESPAAPGYVVEHWEKEFAAIEEDIKQKREFYRRGEDPYENERILDRHFCILPGDCTPFDVEYRRTHALIGLFEERYGLSFARRSAQQVVPVGQADQRPRCGVRQCLTQTSDQRLFPSSGAATGCGDLQSAAGFRLGAVRRPRELLRRRPDRTAPVKRADRILQPCRRRAVHGQEFQGPRRGCRCVRGCRGREWVVSGLEAIEEDVSIRPSCPMTGEHSLLVERKPDRS